MANYLRVAGQNAPQALQQVMQQIQAMNMAQGNDPMLVAQQQGLAGLQGQMQGPQMGGFMQPQMPQGGMGSMQGQIAPQRGVIRGG